MRQMNRDSVFDEDFLVLDNEDSHVKDHYVLLKKQRNESCYMF